jgi:hypothetical protein
MYFLRRQSLTMAGDGGLITLPSVSRTLPSESYPMRTMNLAALLILASPGYLAAATFTVSSTADSGPGTLRQAITDINTAANAADTIQFTVSSGSTITLASSLPAFSGASDITITGGASASYCTIDGASAYSILRFTNAGTSVNVSGLTFINGRAAAASGTQLRGGAIFHAATAETIMVANCHFEDNAAVYTTGATPDADGGAIYTGHNLTLTDCTFTENFVSSTVVDPPWTKTGLR